MRIPRLFRPGLLAGLVAGVSLLAFATEGAASVSISVPCSGGGLALKAAVALANASGGGSINLDPGCTYTLTSAANSNPVTGNNALAKISSDITINGRGATIASNGGNFRLVAVLASGTLTLNGLTITGFNNVIAGGGAIVNHGTLTVNSSRVTGNSGFGGGGIANGGGPTLTSPATLTLNNSEVADNTATGGFFGGGGGIANGSTVVINNSTISGNSAPGGPGGGMLNHGVAMLNHTMVTNNSAFFGAGFFTADFGIPEIPVISLTLNNSQVTGNVASGSAGGIGNGFDGLAAPGTVTLHHTDVSDNTPDNCEPSGTIAGCTG
jgi:hypothetical protein